MDGSAPRVMLMVVMVVVVVLVLVVVAEWEAAQVAHMRGMEELLPGLRRLQSHLCPHSLSPDRFWTIYFVLLHARLPPVSLPLLCTPRVTRARDAVLQALQEPRNLQTGTAPAPAEEGATSAQEGREATSGSSVPTAAHSGSQRTAPEVSAGQSSGEVPVPQEELIKDRFDVIVETSASQPEEHPQPEGERPSEEGITPSWSGISPTVGQAEGTVALPEQAKELPAEGSSAATLAPVGAEETKPQVTPVKASSSDDWGLDDSLDELLAAAGEGLGDAVDLDEDLSFSDLEDDDDVDDNGDETGK